MTKNVKLPQSVMKNSHYAIYYHGVREAHTSEVIRVGCIQGEYKQDYIGDRTTLSNKSRYELVTRSCGTMVSRY